MVARSARRGLYVVGPARTHRYWGFPADTVDGEASSAKPLPERSQPSPFDRLRTGLGSFAVGMSTEPGYSEEPLPHPWLSYSPGVSLTSPIAGVRLERTPTRWLEDRLLIIDIHTHTYPISDDSSLTPDRLIEEAKRIGLDGVCLTDHDGFWTPEEVDELARAHNFLVLPGCEITTEEGHLLVYGLDRYIFGMHRAAFVKQLVDEAGGVVVVAHPYRRAYRQAADTSPGAYYEMLDRACQNTVFPMADAVEVLNGRGSEQENAFSHEIARQFGMRGTGASDAHRLEDLGTFATEFQRPIQRLDDLIHELKAGRFNPLVLNTRTGLHVRR